ncbi:MAG: hypothetical protein RLZZ495_405 [Pseudomonadota bacterium]|jgi:hypothetical protein
MLTRYETDISAWAQEQVALLRSGQWAALDIAHLTEELETMGASQRRELKNRLAVLLQHLLKWNFQPDHRSRSWEATMLEQRSAIADLLDEVPSLRTALPEAFDKAYPLGVRFAAKETGIHERLFPRQCPYELDQVLHEDWLPLDLH